MTNDGTQDPVPPPVLSDPLAGLVTGSRYEPEPLRVRVTDPPMPDISAVRQAMANVLDEDSELDLSAIGPATDFFIDSTSTASPPPAQQQPAQPSGSASAAGRPVAQVPVSQVPAPGSDQAAQAPVPRTGQAPTRGGVTRVPTAPGGIPAQRGAGLSQARELPRAITSGERTRKIRLPSGFMRQGPKLPPRVRGQSSAGSVTLIMLLLFVMAVLGIVFLASFIDSLASMFD